MQGHTICLGYPMRSTEATIPKQMRWACNAVASIRVGCLQPTEHPSWACRRFASWPSHDTRFGHHPRLGRIRDVERSQAERSCVAVSRRPQTGVTAARPDRTGDASSAPPVRLGPEGQPVLVTPGGGYRLRSRPCPCPGGTGLMPPHPLLGVILGQKPSKISAEFRPNFSGFFRPAVQRPGGVGGLRPLP